jgi:hypothetical protein
MRCLQLTWRCAVLALFAATLAACGGAPTYNPTTVPYHIESEKLAEKAVKTVVIAHVNRGGPSRNYLEKTAPRIDAKVAAYLKEKGFKVASQRTFTQHWNTAERAYGNPVDPTSGKLNSRTFAQIMTSVRDEYAKTGKVDAIVFTDLLEVQVSFSGGLKHLARWDGVTLQGPGNSVSADFDWNMQASVASLQIAIYDMDLETLFVSRGGLEATDAIDSRSSKGRYIRRRNMLENDNQLEEGVAIALHPFVPYEDWPGTPD